MQQANQGMTDGERVLRLANELEMSEFDIFRRAYNDWYGREVETSSLEKDFAQYMYFGSTPLWVRHYTRMALDAPRTPAQGIRPGALVTAMSWLLGSRLGRYLLQ